MNLRMTRQALKALESLDAKQYRQVGLAVFGLLKDQQPHDSRALRGAKHGERRIDVGEYRVIYSSSKDVVEILVIGKRNDDAVYQVWERRR